MQSPGQENGVGVIGVGWGEAIGVGWGKVIGVGSSEGIGVGGLGLVGEWSEMWMRGRRLQCYLAICTK